MQPQVHQERIGEQLWRLRRWLVVGVIVALVAAVVSAYRVSLVPPSLTPDSAEFAAASTGVLVDFPGESVVLETRNPVTPLAERAGVFARLAATPEIRELVASRAGVPAAEIDARGPYNPDAERALREPTAEKRAEQLRAERQDYHLRFDTEQNEAAPIVLVYARAPSVAAAESLANAGAWALHEYVRGVQDRQGLPPDKRLHLRTLGPAEGGIVNPNVDRQVAVLTFGAVLLLWTLIVLVVANVRGALWRGPRPTAVERTVPSSGVLELEPEEMRRHLAGTKR